MGQSVHEKALFKLTARELDLRTADAFPNAYLMILGAIQGLAITALMYSFANLFDGFDIAQIRSAILKETEISLLVRHTLAFVTIIVVTFEYIYDVCAFGRYPRYRNIIGPLLLGTFQILSIFVIQDVSKWWLLTALFSLAGTFAYFVTLSTFRSNLVKGTGSFRRTYRVLIGNCLLTLFAAGVCLHAFYEIISGIHSFTSELAHYAAYLSSGFFLILKNRRFLFYLRADLEQEDEDRISHRTAE